MTEQTDLHDDLWPNAQVDTAQRVLLAALALFAAQGYHATSTRQIASAAGLSPAAMYVFYRSKAELHFEISRMGHESVLKVVEAAIAGRASPPERMRALVQVFTSWHAEHNTLARVAQYELQHLAPHHYQVIAALRRRIVSIVKAELLLGAESGEFSVIDVSRTTLAILSLQIDVARWYSGAGQWSPEEVGATYAELVLRMLRPVTAG